ncbi:hypothetical protein GCM10022235_81620 [Kribbella ginsengisoli]
MDVLGERVESWVRSHELAVAAASAGLLLGGCLLFEVIAGSEWSSFVLTVFLVVPLAGRRRALVVCAGIPENLGTWADARIAPQNDLPAALLCRPGDGPSVSRRRWRNRVGRKSSTPREFRCHVPQC